MARIDGHTAKILLACLVMVPLGRGQAAYGVEQVALSLLLVGQRSHVDVQNAMQASADAKVANERAAAAASRAMRHNVRDKAKAISQKVVRLSSTELSKWRTHSAGGKYFRSGKFEARVDHLGYRIRVVEGARQFSTEYFPELDQAIAVAVEATGDPWPRIPGTKHSTGEASVEVASNSSTDLKKTNDSALPEISFSDLVWRYAGKSQEGDWWTDASGGYRIIFGNATKRFDVVVNGKKIVSGLARIDDAMARAQLWSARNNNTTR